MWQLMLILKAWALQLLCVKKAWGWHSWGYLHTGQQFEASLVEQEEGPGGCARVQTSLSSTGPTVISLLSRRKVSRVSFNSRSSLHHRSPGKSQGNLGAQCLPFISVKMLLWQCIKDPWAQPSQPSCFTLVGAVRINDAFAGGVGLLSNWWESRGAGYVSRGAWQTFKLDHSCHNPWLIIWPWNMI